MDLDFISSSPQSIPREHLKSSTVETLIAQNEDLMIKLKTTLRRLSSLEEQNQQILEDHLEIKRQNSAYQDQMAVLIEKDQVWKSKIEQIDIDRALLAEKNIHLSQRLQGQEQEIQRFQKYHEKIKNQVKPYVNQLRKYTADLEAKQDFTDQTIEQKEGQIHDLREQIKELARNSQLQSASQEARLMSAVESYEATILELNHAVESLKLQNREAELKIVKYYKTQEKLDRLENDHIELQRSRDLLKEQLESEVLRLQSLASEIHKCKSLLESENTNLKERWEQISQEVQTLRLSQMQMSQQLESLRYLHSQKNQENEKLKLSVHSLEKLNLELSQKIHEVRLDSEGTPGGTHSL